MMVVTTELATMNMMQLKYVPGNTTELDHPLYAHTLHEHCSRSLYFQLNFGINFKGQKE